MPTGHQLGLRLFLEGIEVPVIGASIQVAVNTPVAASIQVIATDKVLELLPRTVVHLFFYDFVDVASPLSAVPEELTYSADSLNDQYKLLFMGEVQGLAFQKDSGSRAVILNCVDFSNYWDTTYQYNFQGSLLGGRQHAAFIGANANFFNSPLGHGVGTIAALLNGKSVNFPNLKGLLAGTVRILEAIGGSYYGETTFRGANDFTSIAELRLKILQQISAAEKDDSTAKLFARKAFNMWMNREMGSLGKLVTFRGLVDVLQKFIFHEIYPNPTALYQPKVEDLKKTKLYTRRLDQDPRTRGLVDDAKRLRSLLNATQYNLSKLLEVTDNSALEQFRDSASADFSAAEKTLFRMCANPGASIVNRFLTSIRGDMTEAAQYASIGMTGSPNWKLLRDTSNVHRALNAIGRASTTVTALLETKTKHVKEITYDELDRLHNQILRPDIWYCSAPRCNVLFPELYGNFQWQRNFLREVSRMELQTTNELLGDDALFNGRYYAPDVEDMRKGVRLSSRQFGRLTMAHELLTGIIPMFEKLSEANLFAMGKQTEYKGAKVGYAQRAVNFQYFKHRFESRAMMASGRFNPWFVAGFPAVLIDRSMTAGNLALSALTAAEQTSALGIKPVEGEEITRATLLQKLVPVQYCGCCVQLSHTVNQQGGDTSYAFAQARVHRESTELLGVDKATINKKVGTSTKKTVVAVIASLGPTPKKNGRGPRGGRITAVREVTKQYMGRSRTLYNKLDSLEYEIGVSVTESEIVKGYEITEEFTRRMRTRIDLPIEEAVRPPWIWDGWSNLKIGETYMKMLGTNAITDVEGITSKDLLFDIVGADSLAAALETNEGVTCGVKKKEEEDISTFLDRISGTADKPPTGRGSKTKGSKNKVSRPTTTLAESSSAKISASTIMVLEKERTIENAIDYLVKIYSFIVLNGMDVTNFIRNYTWRPVATMTEILGGVDFFIRPKTELKSVGSLNSPSTMTEEKVKGEYIITGREGFHSRAFGDVEDLFGLVDPSVKNILGLSKDKAHAAAKKLDVRKRRRDAVREYMEELTTSRGLLG